MLRCDYATRNQSALQGIRREQIIPVVRFIPLAAELARSVPQIFRRFK